MLLKKPDTKGLFFLFIIDEVKNNINSGKCNDLKPAMALLIVKSISLILDFN